MILKLANASVAETFGVPLSNTTSGEIIADYKSRDWDEQAIKNHIQCSIDAGAYYVEAPRAKKEKANG